LLKLFTPNLNYRLKKIKHSFLCLLFLSVSLWSQNSETSVADLNLSKNKVAVEGYDLTTYFTQDVPSKGYKKWQSNYKEVFYYFKNEANKTLFDANPDQYIPEFGGWCAYALGAYSKKVEIDPESFTIEEGKLYLFYNGIFNNTREKWLDDRDVLKPKAYFNWNKLIQ
jgi:YHS domain-containing protein